MLLGNWVHCQKGSREKKGAKSEEGQVGGDSPVNSHSHCVILSIPKIKKISDGRVLKRVVNISIRI